MNHRLAVPASGIPVIGKTPNLDGCVIVSVPAKPVSRRHLRIGPDGDFAIVAMIVVGKYSDRAGNRIGYCSAAMIMAAIAFMLVPSATSVWLTIVVLCVASVGMFVGLSTFWAIPSSYLRGAEAAGGVALISFFGALGGFASPVLVGWLKDHTGSFAAGCSATAVVLIVGMLLLLFGAKRSSRSEMRSPAPT